MENVSGSGTMGACDSQWRVIGQTMHEEVVAIVFHYLGEKKSTVKLLEWLFVTVSLAFS